MHLGVQIRGHRLPDNTGKLMWSMSAEKCLNEVLHKLDTILLKKGKYLPTNVVKPLFNNYCPEMDVSPLLVQLHHTLYMQLVGILHWAVELGRVDIHLSVALMAQYLAQPYIGYLDQIYHIFAYIKAQLCSIIIMDPTLPSVDHN